MNSSTPIPTKVFAKVYGVKVDNDFAEITFIAWKNRTFYSKTIRQGMRSQDDVLDNLGAQTWSDLEKTKGNVVQLALYDGEPRYINKAVIENGVCRAVWKKAAPKILEPEAFDFRSVPMAPANAKPAGTPPLPGTIGDAEGDAMFPAMIGGVTLTPSGNHEKAIIDHAAREANKVRFLKMSTDMQDMALRLADNFNHIKKIINGGK